MKNEMLILNVIIGGFGGLILSTITTIIYYLLIVRPKKKNKEPLNTKEMIIITNYLAKQKTAIEADIMLIEKHSLGAKPTKVAAFHCFPLSTILPGPPQPSALSDK